MGVESSRPSREYSDLYLPSDTIRVCNPWERCRCPGGGGHHRESRYYYVERGGDGRERFHDPFPYMDRFVMGGGGFPMPWRDIGQWRPRDYGRLGEMMCGWVDSRTLPQQLGDCGGMASVMTTGVPVMLMPDDSMCGWHSGRHRGRGRSYSHYDDRLSRVEQLVKGYKAWQERVSGMENHLYGSMAEMREEQFKKRMIKLIQESQQQGMQQQGMGGDMFGIQPMGGMGMGNMMNPYLAQMRMGMMPQQYGGIGGMGGGPNMAGMGGMGGMPGAGMGSMNDYQNEMLGGGYGGGLGRRAAFGRASRRRPMHNTDEDDDELDDLLASRRPRRKRNQFWERDDDDDLGGFDEGSPLPKPNRGPRRGPRGPNNIPSGGAGAVFEDEARRNVHSRAGSQRPSPELRMPPTTVGDSGINPMPDPVTSPSPPMPAFRSRQQTTMPPGVEQHARMPPAGMMPGMGQWGRSHLGSDMAGVDGSGPPYSYMSGAMPRPVGLQPTRNVSFHVGDGLARPREDEENRGEPEAGGTADRRDALPRRGYQ